jgi:hypothetical protein
MLTVLSPESLGRYARAAIPTGRTTKRDVDRQGERLVVPLAGLQPRVESQDENDQASEEKNH